MHQKKIQTNLTNLARGSSGGVRELTSRTRHAFALRTDLVEGMLRAVSATDSFARRLLLAWNAWEAITGACERGEEKK